MFENGFEKRFAQELGELQELSAAMREKNRSEIESFSHTFPKTCFRCGLCYHNAGIYYSRTKPYPVPVQQANSDPSFAKDFRICSCGATLTILALCDRRDNSGIGRERRDLFDRWLVRLEAESTKSGEDAKRQLRFLFRQFAEGTMAFKVSE